MAELHKKESDSLRRAKNAVRGAFNRPKSPYIETVQGYGKSKLSPADLIMGGFSHLNPTEANQFLEWIKGFPSKAVQVFPTNAIRMANELRLESVTIGMPLLARLTWLSTLLESYLPDLSAFVACKNEFEKAFLVGRYEEAQAILDKIQSQWGYSVWQIEQQILLLQRWKGLDAQKEYARALAKVARSMLAGVASYWISQRNEENTVFSRFRTRLERSIENWRVEEAWRDAYAIILGIQTFDTLEDTRASSALGALATPSLIDAYSATVLALQAILAVREWKAVAPSLEEILGRLPTGDVRISNMASLVRGDFVALELAPTAIADSLCGSVTSSQVAEPPRHAIDCADLIDVAHAKLNGIETDAGRVLAGTPVEELSELVDIATSRSPGFEAKLDHGTKLLANMRYFAVAAATRGYLTAQSLEYTLGTTSPAVLLFINSHRIHPWALPVLPRHFVIRICEELFPDSAFAQLLRGAASGELNSDACACVAINEIAARYSIAANEPIKALRSAKIEEIETNVHARRRLGPLLVRSRLNSGDIEGSIVAAATICALDDDLSGLVSLRALVDEAKLVRANIVDKLSLAIVFHLHLEHRAFNLEHIQRL